MTERGESLYDHLSGNEVAYQVSLALEHARPVEELVDDLGAKLGRPVPAEEILAWLALGAASRKEGRPLLRPVVHAFVRGLGGAVVTFPEDTERPRLFLGRGSQPGSQRSLPDSRDHLHDVRPALLRGARRGPLDTPQAATLGSRPDRPPRQGPEAQGDAGPRRNALMRRCDKLIKRLKGHVTRKRSEAEGVDDINTYGVLAAEGFLPGYGLDTGAVVGSYLAPRFATNLRDWDIRRPLALALREFVPGNLVYANGHRFFPRFFHLEAGEPTLFQVDVASQSVIEVGTATAARAPIGAGTTTLAAVPVCDVELPHQAHISDEEEFRFQLAVSTYGYEQERHGEGQVFTWGGRTLTLRQAVSLRLVNVGAAHLVRDGRLGYPVCLVCGQSRSPLSSEADREFAQHHLERCGRRTEDIGFYADTTADALAIQDFVDRTQGYSVVESLRQAAARVLEMEIDDLQLLALGRLGTESADMLLYDPMPGGSGLLDQMVRRWEEIVKAARELCDDCPAQCHTACIECLLHFRNAFYHRFLDRERALECFRDWGGELVFSHVIPAKLPKRDDQGAAVNFAEATLAVLLEKALDRAGSSA